MMETKPIYQLVQGFVHPQYPQNPINHPEYNQKLPVEPSGSWWGVHYWV